MPLCTLADEPVKDQAEINSGWTLTPIELYMDGSTLGNYRVDA